MMTVELEFLLLEELEDAGVDLVLLSGDIIARRKGVITALDLSGLGLERVPAAVNEMVLLETLDLSGNSISEITNLDNLVELKTLDISGNAISWISGLEGLSSLVSLGLADNAIEKIGGLEGLTCLKHLNLSGNDISETTGLAELPGLAHLDLSRNDIVTVKELYYHVDNIVLDGNPLTLLVLEKYVSLTRDDFVNWVNDYCVDMEFHAGEIPVIPVIAAGRRPVTG